MVAISTEQFFNQSLELNCIAITDGMFLKLKDRWFTILEYRVEELHSKQLLDCVHLPDNRSTRETGSTGRNRSINFDEISQ